MAASEESDCLGSWEEMADSGVLDKQIAQMQAANVSNEGDKLNRSTDSKPLVIFHEEEGRTRFSPAEPTVKILKRPTNGTETLAVNGDSSKTPKVPLKTYEERELAYAEARLRIMGEARSPEEESSIEEKKIQKAPRIDILRVKETTTTIIRHPRGPDETSGFTLQR
ncbi:SUZ domain-containing protein 1 [Macrosteles quadrilineatus]|uniref:SUZ domain-containing protein 1 n=1 Tax=Macrosteles quadrilineatus TaxID=74068 RepID=UPI0023E33409|nr:SUZ domain-containing protein 1 [Macrosteles quadrilineatus]